MNLLLPIIIQVINTCKIHKSQTYIQQSMALNGTLGKWKGSKTVPTKLT